MALSHSPYMHRETFTQIEWWPGQSNLQNEGYNRGGTSRNDSSACWLPRQWLVRQLETWVRAMQVLQVTPEYARVGRHHSSDSRCKAP